MKNIFVIIFLLVGLPAVLYAQKAIRLDSRDTSVFNIETIDGHSFYSLRKDTTLAPGHYEVYETLFRAKNPVMLFQIGTDGNYCGTYVKKSRTGKEIEFRRDYGPCDGLQKPVSK